MIAKAYGAPYSHEGEVIGSPTTRREARDLAEQNLTTRDQRVRVFWNLTDPATVWFFQLDDDGDVDEIET